MRWPPISLCVMLVACGADDRQEEARCVPAMGFERAASSPADKIDLLLVIDNSRSMADKQQILSLAVPDLVASLLNPPCMRGDGTVAAAQPAGALDACPEATTARRFEPIEDIHIGIVSSSIGGHGADSCTGLYEDDHAHLIARSGTGVQDAAVATFEDKGFLYWDPSAKFGGQTDSVQLAADLTTMVMGVGEFGCGFEAPLEAWYRFIADPDPYAKITLENNAAVLEGTDMTLLTQRRDFLRPDSLLMIVMLSDENDCSIRDGGQFYFASQQFQSTGDAYHLPKPRAACAVDPNDPCCRSCGQGPGDGCSDASDDCSEPLSALDDSINLRCFDQKRRFGIDFLWPVDRYVGALTLATLYDRHGNVVANPVFTDLNRDDANSAVRDPGLVFIAGIVGVPWQDIARRGADGMPDLIGGLDGHGRPAGGLQTSSELAFTGTWDVILGDPSCYHRDASCLPTDPLMIESIAPRTGTNPITGAALAPPGAAFLANPINGHEHTINQKDDLQYACIMELPQSRDCTDPGVTDCACQDPANDDPLCQDRTGAFGQVQTHAKSYPAIRELDVLRRAGSQGIVGSICPAQQSDPTRADFGYRPVVRTIGDRIAQVLGGACLPRSLHVDDLGRVACTIIEARVTPPGTTCSDVCSAPGRRHVDSATVVDSIQRDPLFDAAGWNCFCELIQLSGDDLVSCQNALDPAADGWCYVDATSAPPVGNPAVVAHCRDVAKRMVRYVGEGAASSETTLFISCAAPPEGAWQDCSLR